MAITKKQKIANVAELTELISNAKIIVVWEYLGLNANQQAKLRTNIRNSNGINKVFKNRLAKIAFTNSGKTEINDVLTGSSAFLFINNDEQTALKELYKVIKDNDKLNFKGGYINEVFYDAQKITEIAGLPAKDELLSLLLSALTGTIRNLAYSLDQVAKQKESI
ncbi:MAG: 50S ribosomal protein L10 [Mycoplasmataceae bacterium]|nr:50S ribosomal protein L10 [Mycoplasmataceae bacterium]